MLAKKNLKFSLNKQDNTIIFNLSFVLLPTKINLILKKQDQKKNILVAYGSGHIKIIFLLVIKVIAFYIQTFII